MRIPSWILKTAEKDDTPAISFSDPAYDELFSKYKSGSLDDEAADAVEQIEYLRDVMNVAVSKLLKGNSKEAATKELPKDTPAADLPTPPARKEVPPPAPSGATLPARENDKKKEKVPEPEATKWKEIRYNKRDGKWEAIVTTRSVRHFNTEDEAIDFTKKI